MVSSVLLRVAGKVGMCMHVESRHGGRAAVPYGWSCCQMSPRAPTARLTSHLDRVRHWSEGSGRSHLGSFLFFLFCCLKTTHQRSSPSSWVPGAPSADGPPHLQPAAPLGLSGVGEKRLSSAFCGSRSVGAPFCPQHLL